VATFVMVVANGFIVFAFVAGSDPATSDGAVAALAVGMALAPVVFVVLAFGSHHPRAPTGVLYAMGLSLMIGLPLAAIDVVTALAAAFGIGGAVALARGSDDSLVARIVAAILVTVYVAALLRIVVEAGVFGGAVLPLVTIGVADEIMERHAERVRRVEGS